MNKKDKNDLRLRSLSWGDYQITEHRFRELKEFALQYDEKKRGVREATSCSTPTINLEPRGRSSYTTSPTEAAAIRNILRTERLERDIFMIEDAAAFAADVAGYPDAAGIVLASITKGLGFDAILAWAAARDVFVPWSSPDFYAVRRAAFYRLDRLQIAEKERRLKKQEKLKGENDDG